ncbi:MAG: hypothetical protein INR62_05490, partial [Rhodospirillales bacterium]|nr:hypothetical protein [Acetobacter sp.]
MVTIEIRAGAYATAFVGFCAGLNRTAAPRHVAELQAWSQRNNWPAIESRLQSDAALKQSFTSQTKAFTADLNAHRFKSAFTCGLLPRELRTAEHDPSVTHGSELAALTSSAQSPNDGQTDARPTGSSPTGAEASPPPVTPPATNTAPTPTVGTTGVLTAGAATFTPPAGWRVAQSNNGITVLQGTVEKTTALLTIGKYSLTGPFKTAFINAVQSQFPGTGLSFKYITEGTTSGGSPALLLRDTGTLRNKQFENVTAFAVALGQNMQLAVMLSSSFGIATFKARDLMDGMVSNWTLAGESAAAWNPLHPPSPGNARQDFLVGYTVQNQLNPLGGMSLLQVRQFLVLLRSGQALHASPLAGRVFDVNLADQCARQPQTCGTYTIHDNHIDFIWRGDFGMVERTSSSLVNDDSGHLHISNYFGTNAGAIQPAPRNFKLSGRYTKSYVATGNAGQSTTVVAQTYIAFRNDGTYQKSGFSSASFSGSAAAGTVQSRKGVETGTYTLDNYKLTLTPANNTGSSETFTAVLDKVQSNPA